MRITSLSILHNNSPRPKRGESGSMAVEFAMVLPIFLLLLFAAYELGIFLHDQQVITNASREAARLGIIMQIPRITQTEIEQRVIDFSATLLIGANLNCVAGGACPDVTVNNPAGASGTQLSVTVSTPFQFRLLSAFSTFLPNLPVEARTIMVLE